MELTIVLIIFFYHYKGVYNYRDNWTHGKKIDETLLTKKEDFHSTLNKEHITSGIFRYAKGVWKDFKMRNRNGCHDSYVCSDKVLLIDLFVTFQDMCLKIN